MAVSSSKGRSKGVGLGPEAQGIRSLMPRLQRELWGSAGADSAGARADSVCARADSVCARADTAGARADSAGARADSAGAGAIGLPEQLARSQLSFGQGEPLPCCARARGVTPR